LLKLYLPVPYNMKGFFAFITVASAEQPTYSEWAASYGFNSADDTMKDKYEATVAKIEAMNSDPEETAVFAVNQFSGMTPEEFKAAYLTRKEGTSGLPALAVHEWDGSALATSVDWTTQGAVTPIKDQAQCGGCWAFAATGGLEGAKFVATNTLTSLSEQQFLDCDTTDSGCQGGLEYQGWEFFKSHKEGICTEASYPYTGRNGKCVSSGCTLGLEGDAITGITHVGKSADALKSAVAQQPISIGVDAGAWQSYRSGILTKACGNQLDHSVLLVGYSTTGSYFKVKNSWGKAWGEDGFIRLPITGDACGVHDDASYPTVASSVQV